MIFLRIFPILSVLLERTFIIQYVTNVYSFRSESLKECVVLEWFEFLPKRKYSNDLLCFVVLNFCVSLILCFV